MEKLLKYTINKTIATRFHRVNVSSGKKNTILFTTGAEGKHRCVSLF